MKKTCKRTTEALRATFLPSRRYALWLDEYFVSAEFWLGRGRELWRETLARFGKSDDAANTTGCMTCDEALATVERFRNECRGWKRAAENGETGTALFWDDRSSESLWGPAEEREHERIDAAFDAPSPFATVETPADLSELFA